MQVALCIVSVLFGGLHIIAAVSQLKSDKKSVPASIMITGSLLLIGAVICNALRKPLDYIPALLGCAMICAAAIMNGVKSHELHIQHHIIRAALASALAAGFVLL